MPTLLIVVLLVLLVIDAEYKYLQPNWLFSLYFISAGTPVS